MKTLITALAFGMSLGLATTAVADKGGESSAYSGLKLRNIGSAHSSGRISDLAVVPGQPHKYYVGVASGGVWKTENAGTTWTPIFDNYGSYAIGVVELDPKNPEVIWVGTGENNSQRSVADGDGVYKSVDGGKTFKHLGLKKSGHISQIVIDPRNSDRVFVAAQGPLWSNGGDRGLYLTEDGGDSWTRVLDIDQYTGINEVVINTDNPDEMIASSYQRRRHVWTLINGGPGSGVHKSNDGGKTWRKLGGGLPGSELGRIGLIAAPSEPGTVYAIIEANDADKGIYRTTNFGESWEKRSSKLASSPQYYNELVVDPHNANKLFVLDTFTTVSLDGGKTFAQLGIKARHVDDHALWINPEHSNHLRIGGDGGIYESFDNGQHWNHLRNLPLTQFYRIATDNDLPFYNVYGGTQDNNTLGTAVRNTSVEGITNADWWVTLGGDGFDPAIDPTNPDIVYSQYQYGGLARIDRQTREKVYITPQPAEGENALRWNWNSPLLISPHNHERLYYGAEKLFRSDDRGESWVAVSGDLSRGLDRNKLEVMDRVWSIDAIAKNDSTSVYGSLIALDESTLQEGLIAVGTDDGLIHVTNDGGENWARYNKFKGVPGMSLVEDLQFSRHNKDVLYAVFDNHKRGDAKPYVLKSSNRGKSWQSISANLPERGTAHTIVEDHVDPNLLFVGTEYGLFFSQDGGGSWKQLKGIPTIAVRDVEIQRRESDLLVGTFGRGIYVLDDYSPLRTQESDLKNNAATLFPVKDTPIYIETRRWGGYSSDKGMMGDNFFVAPNPDYGVIFSYYLRDGLKTAKATRQANEKKQQKDGVDTPYPSWGALQAEADEEAPSVWLQVSDANGNVIRRVNANNGKGLHRVAWDFRLESRKPVELQPGPGSPWGHTPDAPLATTGSYQVQLMQRHKGSVSTLSQPQSFNLTELNVGVLTTNDRPALQAFQKQTAELHSDIIAAGKYLNEMDNRLKHVLKTIDLTPAAGETLAQQARAIQAELRVAKRLLNGDSIKTGANEKAPMSLSERIGSIPGSHWDSQAAPMGTHRSAYQIAEKQYRQLAAMLKASDSKLVELEKALDKVDAPWTPGRDL
ncbi:glycosyl hydrolase [Porticoccus sp. W117]|uniref:glycosyl hydrolase n=1 Tax=Porticoccus sp. W117 TaxID=3054777 RepID=UPI0025928F7C|nr:glycosyl hydrolase [Porticoccus sp. W117]MDM3870468.1 glycosyl hydrolase [Porticoccus sp. W117]